MDSSASDKFTFSFIIGVTLFSASHICGTEACLESLRPFNDFQDSKQQPSAPTYQPVCEAGGDIHCSCLCSTDLEGRASTLQARVEWGCIGGHMHSVHFLGRAKRKGRSESRGNDPCSWA